MGLERMGYPTRISSILEPDKFPYAVGQGSLGLEIREADERVQGLVGFLDDAGARAECVAERSFLRSLAGGCRVPVGVACSSVTGDGGEVTVTLKGRVWATDGSVEYSAALAGSAAGAAKLGEDVAAAVKAAAGACAVLIHARAATKKRRILTPVPADFAVMQKPMGGATLCRPWPRSKPAGGDPYSISAQVVSRRL